MSTRERHGNGYSHSALQTFFTMTDADIERAKPGGHEGRPGGAPRGKANLGRSVSADVEAVLNDMEQARALAADYQRALASKSNEFAELKQAFERLQCNLGPRRGPANGSVSLAQRLNLNPVAAAEVEALLNDMEQAREMAADYQNALSSKSNEFAELKQVFEKTNRDLAQLQASVAELREERHRLANDGMRAEALELRVQRITKERDDLQAELKELRKVRSAPAVQQVGGLAGEVYEENADPAEATKAMQGADGEVDEGFIHIAYKKDAPTGAGDVEHVKTGMEVPRRSVRTIRTF